MITVYDAEITATYTDHVPDSASITGLGTLTDALSCIVTEELNGAYEVAMVYPAPGAFSSLLAVDRILGITCPLENTIGENYFRIYRVEKDVTGRIYVYARHIAWDLSCVPVRNNTAAKTRVTSVANYSAALRSYALNDFPFLISGNAPMISAYTMPFNTVSSVSSYLGGQGLDEPDKTLLELFDGDFVWDKFNIGFASPRGTDRLHTIQYGVNMENIGIDDDLDDVFTSFVLYYNGDDMKLASDAVETEYASLFPHARTALVDWTFFIPETMTERADILAELNRAAVIYAQNHSELGNPVRRVEVDVVSEEMDDVFLGDWVPVFYRRHNEDINVRMRVIAYEWDAILRRYSRITLGAVKTSLAKVIAETANTEKTLSDVNTRLSSVSELAQSNAESIAKSFQQRGVLPSGDLDDVMDFGTYQIVNANTYTNTPQGETSGMFNVFRYDETDGAVIQMFMGNNNLYYRRYASGTWAAWIPVANTKAPVVTAGKITAGWTAWRRDRVGIITFNSCQLPAGTYTNSNVLMTVSPPPVGMVRALVAVGSDVKVIRIASTGAVTFNNSVTLSSQVYVLGQIVYPLAANV